MDFINSKYIYIFYILLYNMVNEFENLANSQPKKLHKFL